MLVEDIFMAVGCFVVGATKSALVMSGIAVAVALVLLMIDRVRKGKR